MCEARVSTRLIMIIFAETSEILKATEDKTCYLATELLVRVTCRHVTCRHVTCRHVTCRHVTCHIDSLTIQQEMLRYRIIIERKSLYDNLTCNRITVNTAFVPQFSMLRHSNPNMKVFGLHNLIRCPTFDLIHITSRN